VERLGKVAKVATANGAGGMRATLLTRHRWLGHPTVVALAESGADGMVIPDLPKKIPGLGACAACVAAKSVDFPHKERRNRAGAYLDRVHIDIAGQVPTKSAEEYE